MKIKMIATDIDGTLVTDDKRIMPRTVAALKEARKRGIYVVLCSGRPVSGIQDYLEELGLTGNDDYAITFNGAQAMNVGKHEVVFENGLTDLECIDFIKMADDCGIKSQVVTLNSEIYVTNQDISKYSVEDAFYTHMPLRYRRLEDLPTGMDAAKFMWVDQAEKIAAQLDQIPEELYQKYAIVRSAPWFLEFNNANATKGHAVLELAAHLGIKPDEIMVAGDENNDLSMLEQIPFSVAMGNGNPHVKEVSSVITEDNNHDGLGLAVEKYVLS